MPSSSQKREATTDAFALLMGKQKVKRRSTTGSRFVMCPAGCGKHIPEKDVNLHLDKCFQEQQEEEARSQQVAVTQDTTPQKPSDPTDESAHAFPDSKEEATIEPSPAATRSASPIANKSAADARPDEPPQPVASSTAEDSQPNKQVTPETTARATSSGPNTFAHMMEQSKRIFAQNEKQQPLRQTFCLLESGQLLLTFEGRSLQPDQDRFKWSTGVKVRNRSRPETTTVPREVELTLCSFIPSHTEETTRLVRRHSRLSVPVLKSILQKSIRRRRPLPAVRVAMELMDKSMGDLLRRLPVIVLEDSSLHPDLHFLVWLMMAYSKDYVLPPRLILRVLQIVYEVASCQWSDPLTVSLDDGESSSQGVAVSLSSFHEASDSLPKSAEEMIWSMLIRAEYGGMKCDVQMLHNYAAMWKRRFSAGRAPNQVALQLRETADSTEAVDWCNVPSLMHRRAREQSTSRVTSLCETGIDQLHMEDICIEGVDFHCSSVLDHLLSDSELVGVCLDLLVLSSKDVSQIPTSMDERRSWLEDIFKQCMWDFGSGVNRRRPFISNDEKSVDDTDVPAYSNMWNELVAPRVKEFQQKYVRDRLAR